MAMPANVTTVVVLGTFLTPEGNPSTGTVSFTPSSWLTNSGANVAIPNSTVTKTLGTAGDFTVTLPITDDPDLNPENFIYTVAEVVDGVSQNYNIAIPGTIAAGGTIYLADLVPVAPAGPEYYSLASSLSIGTVSTLPAGSAATANITGLAPSQTLDLGIPTGPQGIQGEQGPTGPTGATGPTGPKGDAATIEVGAVTSGTVGGTPSVTNTGTSGSAVFDFVLIPGETGPQGSTGPAGSAATVTVGTIGFVDYPGPGTVTNSGTSGSAVLDFILVRGPQGAIGDLTAADPISYVGSEFSLKYGAGLGTATGGTLVADFFDGSPANLAATASAGTSTELARGDHVHARPTAGDIGAVGTATSITAGTGLAGGGDLSASRTLNVVLSDATPLAVGTPAAGTATSPARADHVHEGTTLSSATPAALGTAAAGTATTAARGDHVHPTTGVVLNSLFGDRGSLISATAANTPAALTVGANDTVLTADSSTSTGLAWKAPASGIPATLLDAKGDLIVATAADTAARLAVGTNGHALVADSGATAGVKWAGVGKVLQVVTTEKTDTFTHTGSTYTEVTGLTVSITPTSTSSRIVVIVSLVGQRSNADTASGMFSLFRGNTNIIGASSPSSRTAAFNGGVQPGNTAHAMENYTFIYVDSPATTSSTTYGVRVRNFGGSEVSYVNRAETDTDNAAVTRGVSTITAVEVGP